MKAVVVAVSLALIPAAGSAQSMNAERFYQRATALQHKGMFALFSSGEIKALTNEAQAAGQRAAENRRMAVKAGQQPRFCPPPGPANMKDKEFMTRLGALPAEDRARIDMTEAMQRILAIKFPCRG
jgi:hypothetical protein